MWEGMEGMPRATLYCRGSDVTVTACRGGDEILVSVIYSKFHKMDEIAIDTFNSAEIIQIQVLPRFMGET